MTNRPSIDDILAESDREVGRFAWDGTFADYLRMVVEDPSRSRLSHSLIYHAIVSKGVATTPEGVPVYGLFDDRIFGLERALDRIVRYFAAAANRLEVRKRILLLLGPPASGKSTVVDLIKRALEEYTHTDEGAVYAISGCPMQEEPLHLVPERLREALLDQHGIYIEGDLCPRCRYTLKAEYDGKVSEMPVSRVAFSEKSALGIGYFVASDPNPIDSSILVGSVDSSLLSGEREEVAGRAFRLDGELNIANRGLMEFVEMFKADKHLLISLLGLAQEQIIKNEKFGSIYAEEAIVGHSNEGDFAAFVSDEHSEALKDRIIAIEVPYNLRVGEEVKIYARMLASGVLENVHLPPLTLRVASVFAVLSRLDMPSRRGMSLLEKLRLYDGQMVVPYDRNDLVEMQRHQPNEGMTGLSPRYVMNRVDNVASSPNVSCVSPLAVLDSLWQGLRENVSLDQGLRENVSLDQGRLTGYVDLVTQSVKEYSELAIKEVQLAFDENFEQTAGMLLEGYLSAIGSTSTVEPQPAADPRDRGVSERDMREIEREVGVAEREKAEFREEIVGIVAAWRDKGLVFDYTSEPRLRAAVEARLFPSRRKLLSALSRPRLARQKAEWARLRGSIQGRLVSNYGYCDHCSDDIINYVARVLRNTPVHKTPKNEGVEWLWPLTHDANGTARAAAQK
jgi:serine protein kinase